MDNLLPTKFSFYDGGAEYMLASEVAKHLNKSLDQLISCYPGLYRRQATAAERSSLSMNVLTAAHLHSPIVTLLLADEFMKVSEDRTDREAEIPAPYKQTVRVQGKRVNLTRSAHAQLLPAKPMDTSRTLPMQRPENPLTSAYKNPHGLSSAGDNEKPELIPIRISAEHDGYRLRDQLLWNIKDTSLTPKTFALMTCRDLELPKAFEPLIIQAIQTQITDYRNCRHLVVAGRTCIINLKVQVGAQLLIDKIIWEHGGLLTPEQYARQTCSDLGLGTPFVAAIAFAIHEALLADKKAAVFDESPDISSHLYKGDPVRKDDLEEWGPLLYALQTDEVMKLDQDENRDSRRARRATRIGPSSVDEDKILGSARKYGKRRSTRRITVGTVPDVVDSPAAEPVVPADEPVGGKRPLTDFEPSAPVKRMLLKHRIPIESIRTPEEVNHEETGANPILPTKIDMEPLVAEIAMERSKTSSAPKNQASKEPRKERKNRLGDWKSDHPPGHVGKRAFTPEVLRFLKGWLKHRLETEPQKGVDLPDPDKREELAKKTGLLPKQLYQWFQNRRKEYYGQYLLTYLNKTD